MQALIGHGGSAAGAVACGLRPPEWGVILHEKLMQVLATHAGSPIPAVTPDGRWISLTHSPSTAEKNAAHASLIRHEEEGRRLASEAYAQEGKPTSYCTIIRNMTLESLDDFEADAVSLWPAL